jgi:hypothetical protein
MINYSAVLTCKLFLKRTTYFNSRGININSSMRNLKMYDNKIMVISLSISGKMLRTTVLTLSRRPGASWCINAMLSDDGYNNLLFGYVKFNEIKTIIIMFLKNFPPVCPCQYIWCTSIFLDRFSCVFFTR